MNNDNYDDSIKREIAAYAEEAEGLDEDEKYHSSGLSDIELCVKTDERSYYIDLKDSDGKVLKTIFVDKHDYLLYMRPVWREWKRKELEKRCLIPAKNSAGYRHCMKDCSTCPHSRNGKPASLDLMKENTKFEPTDESPDPKELALFQEANTMLWDIIRRLSTPEQFEKIRLHFDEDLSYKRIGEIYGVSHKAIEKAILKAMV